MSESYAPSELPPEQPTPAELIARLSDFFQINEVKWKPQTVKGNRALAVAYIDARIVQDRIDDVVGPHNWQTTYETLADGSVRCNLQIRIGGEWITKADVGGQSAQDDAGDRAKAAHSDALKRAAVAWGIGRYLYRLPLTWYDYDQSRRQFSTTPQLPAWARPKPITTTVNQPTTPAVDGGQKQQQKPPAQLPPKEAPQQGNGSKMPASGKELAERMAAFEAAVVKEGKCKKDELVTFVGEWCEASGYGRNLHALDADGIKYAVATAKNFIDGHRQRPEKKPQQQQQKPRPATTSGGGGDAAKTVRVGILAEMKRLGEELEKDFRLKLDPWLSENVHDGLTMDTLEKNPQGWPNEAVSQMHGQLKRWMNDHLPY